MEIRNGMKRMIIAEEAGMLLLSIFLFRFLNYYWWVYPALILVPDIGMAGYLFGPKTGSITYNLLHHKGLAIIAALAGYYSHHDWMMLAGIIVFGHASLDRLMGYGLKYKDSFNNTHLGRIGKEVNTNQVPS